MRTFYYERRLDLLTRMLLNNGDTRWHIARHIVCGIIIRQRVGTGHVVLALREIWIDTHVSLQLCNAWGTRNRSRENLAWRCCNANIDLGHGAECSVCAYIYSMHMRIGIITHMHILYINNLAYILHSAQWLFSESEHEQGVCVCGHLPENASNIKQIFTWFFITIHHSEVCLFCVIKYST